MELAAILIVLGIAIAMLVNYTLGLILLILGIALLLAPLFVR